MIVNIPYIPYQPCVLLSRSLSRQAKSSTTKIPSCDWLSLARQPTWTPSRLFLSKSISTILCTRDITISTIQTLTSQSSTPTLLYCTLYCTYNNPQPTSFTYCQTHIHLHTSYTHTYLLCIPKTTPIYSTAQFCTIISPSPAPIAAYQTLKEPLRTPRHVNRPMGARLGDQALGIRVSSVVVVCPVQ